LTSCLYINRWDASYSTLQASGIIASQREVLPAPVLGLAPIEMACKQV
jgi:hypothetical protein